MNADNPVGVNRPSIQRPCRLLLCCVCPIAPDVVNLIHETPCPLLSSFCRTRLYDVCVCVCSCRCIYSSSFITNTFVCVCRGVILPYPSHRPIHLI
jgi:hypothetical protein